jgi:hypothetical protein
VFLEGELVGGEADGVIADACEGGRGGACFAVVCAGALSLAFVSRECVAAGVRGGDCIADTVGE